MHKNQNITNLEQLLKRIDEAVRDQERVSLGLILEVVEHRSFGPILLVAGLVMLAPLIGDIPGVPVMMGVLVVLTAGQLLFRREHLWLPRWLLKRSVAQDKLDKALGWMRPPARFVDRLLRQRLTMFTESPRTTRHTRGATRALCPQQPLAYILPQPLHDASYSTRAYGRMVVSSLRRQGRLLPASACHRHV